MMGTGCMELALGSIALGQVEAEEVVGIGVDDACRCLK